MAMPPRGVASQQGCTEVSVSLQEVMSPPRPGNGMATLRVHRKTETAYTGAIKFNGFHQFAIHINPIRDGRAWSTELNVEF